MSKLTEMTRGIPMPKGEGKLIAQNKKARHDYAVEETYRSGTCASGDRNQSDPRWPRELEGFLCACSKWRNLRTQYAYQLRMSREIDSIMNRSEHASCSFIKKQINKLIGDSKEAGYSHRSSEAIHQKWCSEASDRPGTR